MIRFYRLYEQISGSIRDYEDNSFKSWLLMSEINKATVKNLTTWQRENPDDLPFQDLFKGADTRTIIPFYVDPAAASILDKLKQQGLEIDFRTGTVSNGKRQLRLGKYLLNTRSSFTPQEKNWWTHSGNPLQELKNAQKTQNYSIVISRNPIDIARMSDHDGWTSCHATGKEYFHCAVADAKGAGGIAYVVKTKDLAEINLQAPEIFKDAERGIPGVVPVSRVRLRKFVHKKDNYDLAVPEDRTYGQQFPGLEDSVRNWAWESQQDKLNGERPPLKDFKLMGGSYQDTQSSDLFNYFFGDELDSDDAEYGGGDEGATNMADQMQDEIDLIGRQFQNKFTVCSFYASVEESDGRPYVSYHGSIRLTLPEELMIPQPKESDDLPYAETRKYKLRKEIEKWAKNTDIGHPDEVEILPNGANISIKDEDSNLDPDSFREFLQLVLLHLDDQAENLRNSLYHLFIELGLAKPNKAVKLRSTIDTHRLKNFSMEESDGEVIVSLGQLISLPVSAETPSHGGLPDKILEIMNKSSTFNDMLRQELINSLTAWANKVETENARQNYKQGKPFSSEFKIAPIIKISIKTMHYT